jgi:hypothetical protein
VRQQATPRKMKSVAILAASGSIAGFVGAQQLG